MKIHQELLQEFIEDRVEPEFEGLLTGELSINYDEFKGDKFTVITPSKYHLEDTLFGEPLINFHASSVKFHKFGIPKGNDKGMIKVECYYQGYRFYLLFKLIKGE